VKRKSLLILGLILAVFSAAGCRQDSNLPGEASATSEGLITPYLTATLAATHPIATELATPTPPPLPTPTPFMYTVVENDTMIAIAVRFGVTLDDLQLANPEVSPNFLSIGTQLVIPINFDDEEQGASGNEVLPLVEGTLECTSVRSGGMWCYWLMINPLEQAVENISGVIRLYDQDGEQVASGQAVAALNIIGPGQQAPLGVYFPPPVPDWQLAQGQLVSAVTANQYEQRYLQGEFEQLEVDIHPDRLSAQVSGRIRFNGGQQPEYVWILAVAYDLEGIVVGVRRWEAPAEDLSDVLNLSFEVFSLERPIDRVDVIFEARADSAE
jgi:LysM repeat protein